MPRIHLTYKEADFPEPILELTRRFMEQRPWRAKTPVGVFNIWAHGANLHWDLPECDVVYEQHPAGIGTYTAATDSTVALIKLHKPSVISFFHQYRHHMQANADYKYKNEEHEATDAQMWATSLFYVTNPSMFRRAVRAGNIMGVKAGDLLKRKRRVS